MNFVVYIMNKFNFTIRHNAEIFESVITRSFSFDNVMLIIDFYKYIRIF